MPTAPPKPARGRPAKPAAAVKSHSLNVRLAPAEWAALMAYRDGLGVHDLAPGTVGRDAIVKFLKSKDLLPVE